MDIEKLFNEPPTFKTSRLVLRRMEMDDANDYYEFASDPEVTRHTIWDAYKTLEETQSYLQLVLDKYSKKQAYHWGIIDLSTNKLIGRTGLIDFDSYHQKTEIGFALSREYWNKGIITEATQEIIRYCFNELNVNRIEGRCNFDNPGSSRVLEKLGMVFEGILRDQLKIKGNFKNQRMYSILKKDFEGRIEEDNSFR